MTIDESTRKNLAESSTWLRLIYIILFVVIFNIVEFVLWVVVLVQFLAKLFTGNVIAQVSALGQILATYIYQIVLFLTFKSDEMPYPFGPWPSAAPETKPPAKPPAKRGRKPKAGGDSAD